MAPPELALNDDYPGCSRDGSIACDYLWRYITPVVDVKKLFLEEI